MLFNGILVSVNGQIEEEKENQENQNIIHTKVTTDHEEEKHGTMQR